MKTRRAPTEADALSAIS